MAKGRVLFVNQEITPYLKESKKSYFGRYLPQYIQESGKEIRNFMPRFGNINERKNQLHEVIRLSGINLIIQDSDHPLIIKVASIQIARMQVYFIDNEDFFQRKYDLFDGENKFYEDNDERVIFFSRGVLETIKKLNWQPNIIHCTGWFAALISLYVKCTNYKDNPLFATSKIVISLFEDEFNDMLCKDFINKLKESGAEDNDLELFKEPTYINFIKAAILNSDGVVLASPDVNPELVAFAKKNNKPIVDYAPLEEQTPKINELYDQIMILEKD